MIIRDVDGIDGAQIVIEERGVPMFGSMILIYQGECRIDGKPARYLDCDSAGRTLRKLLPIRPAQHSPLGLERLIDALERDLRESELAR